MKINEVFIDTNIPMYAAGQSSPLRDFSLKILKAVAEGRLTAYTDTEVFQEILHRFLSVKKIKEGLRIFDDFLRLMAEKVYPITVAEVKKARHLAEKYPESKARDLLHLSVMVNKNIKLIATFDSHFDVFEEVERLK